MNTYKPYRNNPYSVKSWLSSHVAMQYNWQMLERCLGFMIPAIIFFAIDIPFLSEQQNLFVNSMVFIFVIVAIIILSYIRQPNFITTDKLTQNNSKITIFGQDVVSLFYFFSNYSERTADLKSIESRRPPIDLLFSIEDKKLMADSFNLIEYEGGVQPRKIEQISIFLILCFIFSQWFFLLAMIDNQSGLIYEPNWLKNLVDWLMGQAHFIPLTNNQGWMLMDLEDYPQLLSILPNEQAVFNHPLLRSTVLYHCWALVNVPMNLFCLYQIICYRKTALAYDKIAPQYHTSDPDILKRLILVFGLVLMNFGFIVVSYSAIEFTSLPNVATHNWFYSSIFTAIFYPMAMLFLFLLVDFFFSMKKLTRR